MSSVAPKGSLKLLLPGSTVSKKNLIGPLSIMTDRSFVQSPSRFFFLGLRFSNLFFFFKWAYEIDRFGKCSIWHVRLILAEGLIT